MSIYSDLNNVQLDLSQYEENRLSEIEQKRWERRVRRKLHRQNSSIPKRWVGIAATFTLILGATLSFTQISLAQIPFSKMFEDILGNGHHVDYSAYKTAIGETAENAQGRITLNEVMIEGDRLLINSTFEPAEGVTFNDSSNLLIPHVTVNGLEGQTDGMSTGQSPEQNDSQYSVFGSIELNNLPLHDRTHVKISYDVLNVNADKPIKVKQPWVFDIKVSTSAINRDSNTLPCNKMINLGDFGKITLETVIASPISTVIYFDDTSMTSELVKFELMSLSGKVINQTQSRLYRFDVMGQASWIRYNPIDLKKESYLLIPVSTKTGKKLGEPVELKL